MKELLFRAGDIGASMMLNLEESMRAKVGDIDTTKTFDIVGDSLSAGDASETYQTWHTRLTGIENWSVQPYAYSGQPFFTFKVPASAIVARKGSSQAIVAIWQGTNDIQGYSKTGQNVYDAVKAYCQTCQAGGVQTIVANLPELPSPYDTEAQAFNTLLAADSSFADAVVDLRSVFPDYSDLTYHDGSLVHYNDVGNAMAAAAFQSALDTLLAA